MNLIHPKRDCLFPQFFLTLVCLFLKIHALALVPCPTPDTSRFLIQPNDKIVFMGDSITFRGNYTRQLINYLNTRYPNYHLQFTNTGVSGWKSQDALNYSGPLPQGLTYVLSLHPNIVTLCFGMNDGGYISGTTTAGVSNYNNFQNSMTQLVNQLQANGIQVVLLSPEIVDLSVPGTSWIDPNYNTVLQTYASWIMNFAASNDLPAFDLHQLGMNVDQAAKAALPGYEMHPDQGIHPDMAGGLVYTYGFLKALGVPDRCQLINLDCSSLSLSASAGIKAGPLQAIAGGWSFQLTLDPMPFVPGPADAKILPYLSFQQDFNEIGLSATGLSAANYYVVIDGFRSGQALSQGQLASGINLSDYWTQPAHAVDEVHQVQLLDASLFSGPASYNETFQCLVDDMESSNTQPTWPSNLWGGLWFGYAGSGMATSSPSPFLMTSPGYNSSYAARVSGNVDVNGYAPGLYTDVLTRYLNTRDGIQFWFKALSGTTVRFQIHTQYESSNNLYNDYGFLLNGSYCTGNWVLVQIPYSSLSLPWPPSYSFDPADIVDINWLAQTPGAYDFSIDSLEFYSVSVQPTPTLTPTFTPCGFCTPTFTPTFPPTFTFTATATKSSIPPATGTLNAVPGPNPNPSQLFLQSSSAAQGVECRLYTPAFQLAWHAVLSVQIKPGWNALTLPQGWDTGLGGGLYHLVVKTSLASARTKIYLVK